MRLGSVDHFDLTLRSCGSREGDVRIHEPVNYGVSTFKANMGVVDPPKPWVEAVPKSLRRYFESS